MAVAASDIDISWSQLKQKVDDQVNRLRQETNGLMMPVILYGHKEADFIVLILACLILKTPFVPIDISYPKKRIDKIKQQLGRGLLVDVASHLITPFGKKEALLQNNQDVIPWLILFLPLVAQGSQKGCKLMSQI
nr:AMP-binding protein [Bathymodiolus septemdierum thioautotrophic gill symbiont]